MALNLACCALPRHNRGPSTAGHWSVIPKRTTTAGPFGVEAQRNGHAAGRVGTVVGTAVAMNSTIQPGRQEISVVDVAFFPHVFTFLLLLRLLLLRISQYQPSLLCDIMKKDVVEMLGKQKGLW